MGLPKSNRRMHSDVRAFQMRTSWSKDPDANTCGLLGWNRTTHGVRLCPASVARHLPVAQSMSLTVWSPWVDARVLPSGENAAAMVDRGAGRSSLYVAVQLLSESASAHDARPRWSEIDGSHWSTGDTAPPRRGPDVWSGRRPEVLGSPPRVALPSRPVGSSSRARIRAYMASTTSARGQIRVRVPGTKKEMSPGSPSLFPLSSGRVPIGTQSGTACAAAGVGTFGRSAVVTGGAIRVVTTLPRARV